MATVYRGMQLSLARPVAIKVLSTPLATEPLLRTRFHNEAALVAQLAHPNIISVIDRGVSRDGRPYFVMPYIKGVDLRAVIGRGDVRMARRLDIALQLCKGLAYAHRNGVVHRDIKPANVLVDFDGVVRLADFGIAGYLQRPDASEGLVMGTPGYMAPEQVGSALACTEASDLYSFGVLLHELLTGQRPGEGITLERPPLPETLWAVIQQCLAEEPDARPRSAEDLARQVLLVLQGSHLAAEQRQRASEDGALGNRYRLLDVLKENRYGASYLVQEKTRQRLLVVKKQPVKHVGRALKSANALARRRHPRLATVHGSASNTRFFITVTDHVAGGSLDERLRQGVDARQWRQWLREALEGLGFAHALGVVHGNLRPSNLLLDRHEHLVLTDFGFARHDGEGDDWYQPGPTGASSQEDLYALGAVFYRLMTGRVWPHKGSALERWRALRRLPSSLRNVLRGLLAKRVATIDKALSLLDPAETVEDVTLIQATRQFLAPRLGRTWMWIALGVSMLFNVLLMGWLLVT